jgi:hypothetical protein
MARTPDPATPVGQPTDLLATPAELRAAATKLDAHADELEGVGKTIAGAAGGGGMGGFRLALAAAETLGQVQSCSDMNVRELREMANRLRSTAQEYERRGQIYTQSMRTT